MAKIAGDCGNAVPRLGGIECDISQDTRIYFVKRGVQFDYDEDFTSFSYKIKKGHIIGCITFQDATHENQEASIIRGSQGTATKRSDGIKGWMFKFDFSVCKDNELSRLDRSRQWGIVFQNANGDLLVKDNEDGTWEGFECYIYTDQYQNLLTADEYGSTAHVELEIASNASWKTSKARVNAKDFSYKAINPVEGVGFVLETMPVVSDTELKVKVTGSCNDNFISGLDDTTLKLFHTDNAGVTTEIVLSSVVEDPSTKMYTLTLASLVAGVYSLEINDGVGKVIALSSSFYAGELEFTIS